MALKKRYLIRFSYVGTYFKSSSKASKVSDCTSIIGALETALREISIRTSENKKVFEASPVVISSRTDAGVHALQNAAHVDLFGTFCSNILCSRINIFFMKEKIPLRVLNISQVSDEFDARRFATKRTYLYRFAVPYAHDQCKGDFAIPISECDRCYFLQKPNFNLEALKEAVSLFPGNRDFTSFCGRPKEQEEQGRSFIRNLHSFYVRPGRPYLHHSYDSLSNHYQYWDIIAEGSSFIYQQVRRMVAAALNVAEGKYSIDDVKLMLDTPSRHPKLHYRLVPAHGLYLLGVTYNDAHLAVDWSRKGMLDAYSKLITVFTQHKFSLGKQSLNEREKC